MDAHQRAMWQRMIQRIDDYKAGTVELGALLDDLRGLLVEANPPDETIRSESEEYWSPIDMEYELRTEAWAPGLGGRPNTCGGS